MEKQNDWRPAATLETLKFRARMLAGIRSFFAARGVLEVETPILSHAGAADPNLHSLAAQSLAPDDDRLRGFLHTSPEFAMKRLLAAGSESIYQICKVFRGGEAGRLHNPEFTMLEWYRIGYGYHELIDDVAALVTHALGEQRQLASYEKLSYRDAFRRYGGIDPFESQVAELAACAAKHHIHSDGLDDLDLDGWRDLLLTHVVEPNLGRGRLTFLYDYPATQAALARVRAGDPPVAERFELYLRGVELANGFHELSDAEEQRHRFEKDLETRNAQALAPVPFDRFLLAALERGLPECSGVALGVDRLVMLAANADSIDDVLAFPFDRA